MKVRLTESELHEFVKGYAIKAINEARNKRGVINELYRFVRPFTTVMQGSPWF